MRIDSVSHLLYLLVAAQQEHTWELVHNVARLSFPSKCVVLMKNEEHYISILPTLKSTIYDPIIIIQDDSGRTDVQTVSSSSRPVRR